MTAGSQFPDLDPDRASGFWKQHFSSNTLRRVSVSLQSDKITQKTFKGREHHTEEEREPNSGATREGKMSTTRESPVSIQVRQSKRREHSLWQQFELFSPFPSSVAGRHELPPFGERTLQRIHRDGGVTTAAARRRDVHEVYTYGTQKKYAASRSVMWKIPSTHVLLARR